ncbi:MAG: tRNA (guanosine(37)-N1)-methyltransferase TrmD, partial [Victivallales bacterium]|nr:tRNA (guanosine(37)-N1)-methyltransferase TrmD [Victivallales bacterium]
VTIRHLNLRDYAEDQRGTVDDSPFGDGVGMLLKPEIVWRCMTDLRTQESHAVFLCPQGQPFTQRKARQLASHWHLILFAGHYEGIDDRARQALFDEELSLGDFVLTNGAIAAAAVADAVIRLLPGVLGKDESSAEESFGGTDILEYPHFTRPATCNTLPVPEELLSGDHEAIRQWRWQQRLIRTAARRPDLLERYLEHR